MRIKAYSYKYTTNFPQSINSLKWSKRNETPAEKWNFAAVFLNMFLTAVFLWCRCIACGSHHLKNLVRTDQHSEVTGSRNSIVHSNLFHHLIFQIPTNSSANLTRNTRDAMLNLCHTRIVVSCFFSVQCHAPYKRNVLRHVDDEPFWMLVNPVRLGFW